jgi:hypothetical protein
VILLAALGDIAQSLNKASEKRAGDELPLAGEEMFKTETPELDANVGAAVAEPQPRAARAASKRCSASVVSGTRTTRAGTA